MIQVLSVGLFDGVSCLRMACDVLGLPMAGQVSVEKAPEGSRVVEAAFAETIFVEDVTLVEEMVMQWAGRFPQVGLGAGPPCQGVSGLNADKRGALKDHRSCLFQHVPRIKALLQRNFPWAQVRCLMESVSSMDVEDRAVMSKSIGEIPFRINASDVALASQPRLYWLDWELQPGHSVLISYHPDAVWGDFHEVSLKTTLDSKDYLKPGWLLQRDDQRLPTFTTSRPSSTPGRRPAGLQLCDSDE